MSKFKDRFLHFFASYLRIVRYVRPYRSIFIVALLCMVFFGATDGGIPFLIKYVLDDVFSNQDQELLYLLPLILVVFSVLRGLFEFGQGFLMAKVGHNIVRDLRNAINRHLLALSPDYFLVNSSANLLSRITSDVMLVRQFLTDSLAAIIRDVIRIVALLIAAIYLDPLLALIAFVVFPIGVFPVYRFGKKMRKLSRRGQESIGNISSLMHESIAGHRVVRIFGREQYEDDRFAAENENVNRTFIKSEMVRNIVGPINEILAATVISAVILYGGYSVIGGLRSQGEFLAFLVAVFLLYDPFKKLSRINNVVQQGMAGAERVFEILDTKPSIPDPVEPKPLSSSNDISFTDITFSYKRNERPALEAINLKIEEDQRYAFVGLSGAGKSTLVDLIPRFIEPQLGVIKIGGVDISTVSLADLRSRIAMVGQHTFLFNDTIYNNIAYGKPNATFEEVVDASKTAYAYDFVMQLPQQFETLVGEGGFTLSGGERQRLAIARAVLKDAPILIMDEATASLDNRSEREVQAALEALAKNKTSLIIAHRLSTVINADCIVVLKAGRIVEVGTHDQLLLRNGEYQKLYNLQFRDQREEDAIDAAVR